MTSPPPPVCSQAADPLAVCGGNVEQHSGAHYCLLHLPTNEKDVVEFAETVREMLRRGVSSFRGVWFPEKVLFDVFDLDQPLILTSATFNEEIKLESKVFKHPVTFDFATFNKPVTFRSASFEGPINFSSARFEAPVTFARAKFQADANFNSTIFEQDASFSYVVEGDLKHRTEFEAKADFSQARFRKRADFRGVTVKTEANFYDAKFSSITNFDEAEFKGIANFDAVTFEGGINFNSATFDGICNVRGASFEYRVFFDDTSFKGDANFNLTSFKDSVRFKGKDVFHPTSTPNFKEAKFHNPELVSFHSVSLRPYWFVDVNASEFDMVNVDWNWPHLSIEQEIQGLVNRHKDVKSPYPLLGIACWNLAVNAEEKHRYEEASRFRYLAMEARRRSTSLRKSSPAMLHWLYWLLSGYGERILQAFGVLIGIWVLFACIYAATLNDKEGKPLRWRALTYSASVIMLQKPEPVPTTPGLHGLVILETVLGPVQAALLALAIRRKFMR
jgi:uncharacterized protein YjbI with pentapeptide repeats